MEFVKFKRAVHAQFNQLAAGADMLFLTNVDKDALWDCYLNSFPEEERQSHNCNNCKHYIRHYGRLSNNLVTLTAPVNKDAKNLFKWPNNFAWEGKSLEELAKELEALN